MNQQLNNWNQTPLLRASTNVINTPVKTTAASPCAGFIPRYNVGNIHEIKQLWSVPQAA
ncbi:hypothetical protein SAMN04488483_0326 [Pseudomonas helmanticensis]|uniref:Uncharacterized protein n=1 Tax=Pseudomonas helmanticensis TaxID=1471381 RepID=A0ACD2TZM6_9PSED|nr:hypothetical protein [Pseudomonas helmanticensis]SMQ22420.1 hypothetical protein SAMN04488483_0326 [Pseudomonas helmanticensis]